MRQVKIYDSYRGKIEEFKPLKDGEVSIYYCGPTVYNHMHLGNFRTVITFDLLTRVLKEIGYNVKTVSNYTDIDDKIIKAASEEKISEKNLSSLYIKEYEILLDKLNILPLYAHPKASEYIEKMTLFINDLIKSGYAYKKGNDIFFRVSKVEEYGKLSKQTVDDLVSGSRIDVNLNKENPLDFILWKLTDDDGIKFDTIIGKGRPGWHTECVCMVNEVFSSPIIDIHGGGFDLKFPHHENEIAQSIAHNGTKLANYWMHCGFLMTNGEKMSKSLNNSMYAKDVLSRHTGNVVRMFFYSTSYRSPINYDEDVLSSIDDKDKKIYASLKKAIYRLALSNYKENETIDTADYEEFLSYLLDDLKVTKSVTVLEKKLNELNSLLAGGKSSLDDICRVKNTVLKMTSLLGLSYPVESLKDEDIAVYNSYIKARDEKDYVRSDSLRKILIEKGIL